MLIVTHISLLSYSAQVVTVNSLPLDIFITPLSVAEDVLMGSPVTTLHTNDTDQGQTFTYTLLHQEPEGKTYKRRVKID